MPWHLWVTIGQGRLVFEASTPPTSASPRIEVGLPALRGPHTHGGTPSFRALSEAKAGMNQARVKGGWDATLELHRKHPGSDGTRDGGGLAYRRRAGCWGTGKCGSLLTKREGGTAYRDSPKSRCWVCLNIHGELDKSALVLSFHSEQWGQLEHYPHVCSEVVSSDWPLEKWAEWAVLSVVVSHLIFRLILISPQSLWTAVTPPLQVLFVFMYIRVGQRKSRGRKRVFGPWS